MVKKILLIFISSCLFCNMSDAQNAMFKGVLQSSYNNHVLSEMDVSIPRLKIMTTTDALGVFSFSDVKLGQYTLIITDGYGFVDSVKINIDGNNVDFGVLKINYQASDFNAAAAQTAAFSMDESSSTADEEGVSSQNISGVLNASRDPYLSAAAFNFGNFRYQIRGYNRNQLEVYLNGLQMNDVEIGTAFWGQWGGLNDVFKNQHSQFALQAGENGFGGLLGTIAMNATAAEQTKQTRFSYTAANRSYRNRIMLSHCTGLMSNGWAFAVAGSKRWANEAYVPGTSYNSYSYYIGISKKLKAASMLHLTVLGSPTIQGKSSPVTLETIALAGSPYYNPNWGYLNGEKRNAKMNHSFQPIFMLNYDYVPDNTTKVGLVASYQFGVNVNSGLDWYNAQDPRPDYYRNLPSYYEMDEATANPDAAQKIRNAWMTDERARQINWNRLFETNALNYQTVNGVAGKRSLYVVGEDCDAIRKYSIAADLQKVVNENLSFSGGFLFVSQQTESYKKMADLLGGDYYVNLNQFAERTYAGNSAFSQNDLNHPDGIIRVGDKYAYDYKATFRKTLAWGQLSFSYHKIDFFIAGRAGQNVFRRDGVYKNGLFADDSYGKSPNQNFFYYQVKAGATYKIDGRHYLYVNAAVMTAPPVFDNVFISPRTRNITVDKPQNENIQSIEGGYLIRAPRINGRLSGFVTEIKDATKIMRFYHEDYRTFVNYVMRNVSIRHIGAELALQAKLSPSLSATLVAAWMQIYNASNPDISIYRDNDTTTLVSQSVAYLKNTYVASGPQSAYAFGLNYRSPKFWYVNVNINYLHRNYIDINPTRYTTEVLEFVPKQSNQWHAIVDQEQLTAACTVDLFAGKSFLLSKPMKWLPHGTCLFVNLGINNLLNNKNIQTGGFEQLRFDVATLNPDRFPSKYFYGLGATYFINLSLKF